MHDLGCIVTSNLSLYRNTCRKIAKFCYLRIGTELLDAKIIYRLGNENNIVYYLFFIYIYL